MNIQKLKDYGFVEKTYDEQEGVFFVKTLRVSDIQRLLSEEGVGPNDDVIIEVTPQLTIQLVINSIDYVEEAVKLESLDGIALMNDAGVDVSQVILKKNKENLNSDYVFEPLRMLIQSKIDSLPTVEISGFECVSLNQLGLCMFIVENADEIRKILNSVDDATI